MLFLIFYTICDHKALYYYREKAFYWTAEGQRHVNERKQNFQEKRPPPPSIPLPSVPPPECEYVTATYANRSTYLPVPTTSNNATGSGRKIYLPLATTDPTALGSERSTYLLEPTTNSNTLASKRVPSQVPNTDTNAERPTYLPVSTINTDIASKRPGYLPVQTTDVNNCNANQPIYKPKPILRTNASSQLGDSRNQQTTSVETCPYVSFNKDEPLSLVSPSSTVSTILSPMSEEEVCRGDTSLFNILRNGLSTIQSPITAMKTAYGKLNFSLPQEDTYIPCYITSYKYTGTSEISEPLKSPLREDTTGGINESIQERFRKSTSTHLENNDQLMDHDKEMDGTFDLSYDSTLTYESDSNTCRSDTLLNISTSADRDWESAVQTLGNKYGTGPIASLGLETPPDSRANSFGSNKGIREGNDQNIEGTYIVNIIEESIPAHLDSTLVNS